MKNLIYLALIFTLALTVTQAGLKEKRVSLMDYNATAQTYLFRGNVPVADNKTFQYNELKAIFLKKALEKNITLDDDFYLIDISLLDRIDEITKRPLHTEETFFKSNPELGEVINWAPIIGNELTNPKKLNEKRRKELVESGDWDHDHFRYRVDKMHEMLGGSNRTKPVVIYLHCIAGVDRTGEMSGGYYMKYLNWTYVETLTFDYAVDNRPICKQQENALDFYCWDLFYKNGYPTDCDKGIPRYERDEIYEVGVSV